MAQTNVALTNVVQIKILEDAKEDLSALLEFVNHMVNMMQVQRFLRIHF